MCRSCNNLETDVKCQTFSEVQLRFVSDGKDSYFIDNPFAVGQGIKYIPQALHVTFIVIIIIIIIIVPEVVKKLVPPWQHSVMPQRLWL